MGIIVYSEMCGGLLGVFSFHFKLVISTRLHQYTQCLFCFLILEGYKVCGNRL